MQIDTFHSAALHIDHFQLKAGEAWCFIGANNSGISEFIQLLAEGSLHTNNTPDEQSVVLSFGRLQEIFEQELKKDDTDFLDRIDSGTPARNFFDNLEQVAPLIEAFNFTHCLDKGYRQLSTGESRKLLLLSALSAHPTTIVLETPYDGLDSASCTELDHAMQALYQLGKKILITVNNEHDIPSWCSHLGVLQRGRLVSQGRLQEVLPQLRKLPAADQSISLALDSPEQQHISDDNELIVLTGGHASYGDTKIFANLDLSVYSTQHTLITGPNGSGKSTLLQIITGDNPKCYGNDLRLFGRQRGTGESIWEIKKEMGIVSPDLHRSYYIPGSALQVVLSGFFDSIGVYLNVSAQQRQEGLKWLRMTGLEKKVSAPFRRLSYGEQRLCLIARALIKMPRLLILDEPTQGLDQANRHNLLDFLEQIARHQRSTILYVSHRSDEFRPFFKQHLDLSQYQES